MKNPFTVLRAFRKVHSNNSELIFLGEGDLRPSLTKEIMKSNLESAVNLKGMVSRDSVFDNFADADLFISASWGEGLPVAVLEAMACRCPVLLSDIPPHREITEGIDFIPLIKPDDVSGFAREISRFQEMTPAEREIIGNQCRKLVEDRFSLSVMHSEYAKVYTELTGKRFPELLEKMK
jgi:glycosyltransferase involved in cell wall biosynthesis